MKPISNNTLPELSPAKQSRRRHSPAFKARVLAACADPGVSVAAVAQHYGVNANLIHKWRKAARDSGNPPNESAGFIPVPVPGSVGTDKDLQVTFTLGQLIVQWPISHIHQAAPWLKAWQA